MKKFYVICFLFIILLFTLTACEQNNQANNNNEQNGNEIEENNQVNDRNEQKENVTEENNDETEEDNNPLVIEGDSCAIGPSFFVIRVETSKRKYKYDEIINLKVEIGDASNTFDLMGFKSIIKGNLHVKLETNGHFDIIGNSEYVFEDNSNSRIIEFNIKPLKEIRLPGELQLKMKFDMYEVAENYFYNANDGHEPGGVDYDVDFSEEYFLTHQLIGYMTDVDTMNLFYWGNASFEFEKIINRQYEEGILSKQEYIYRYFEYSLQSGKPGVRIISNGYRVMSGEDAGKLYMELTIIYISNNFTAELVVENEDIKEMFWGLRKTNPFPNWDNIWGAKMVVESLYKKGKINYTQYQNELSLIEKGLNGIYLLHLEEKMIIEYLHDYELTI